MPARATAHSASFDDSTWVSGRPSVPASGQVIPIAGSKGCTPVLAIRRVRRRAQVDDRGPLTERDEAATETDLEVRTAAVHVVEHDAVPVSERR